MAVASPSVLEAVVKTMVSLHSLKSTRIEAFLNKSILNVLLFRSIEEFMGGRGGRGGPKKEIDNTKYYTLLNCTKESTQDEVKKNFRKIAIKEHPDKGGDPEKVSVNAQTERC